jgi:hypothetical protein
MKTTILGFAAAGAVVLGLAACGTGPAASPASGTTAASPASQAPDSQAPIGNPAAVPSGLACNPQDSSCWLPQVAQPPQEEFISYLPAKSYSSAYDLASALGCQVMPADGAYAPSAQGVNCETGPAAGVTLYSSPQAETGPAQTDLSYASNVGDVYAVFGPGWESGGGDGQYTNAKQIQDAVGGELVCFSDGVTVDGIPPCCATTSQGCTTS